MEEYEIIVSGKKQKVSLKDGWETVQRNPDYWDFDKIVMELPYMENKAEGEREFLVSQLSFKRDVQSGEFVGVYMTILQNVPTGDHKELTTLTLDLNDAISKVFERIGL